MKAMDVIPKKVKKNLDVYLIIKCTILKGFTGFIQKNIGVTMIIFSPEFLHKSKALYNNVYPKFSVD